MLRSGGVEISAIACASAGHSRPDPRIVLDVGEDRPGAEPARRPTKRISRSPRIRASPITTRGRLLPPLHVRVEVRAAGDERARRGPRPPSSRPPPPTVRGRAVSKARKAKHGVRPSPGARRTGARAPHPPAPSRRVARPAVPSLGRRRDPHRLGIRDAGKLRRAEARGLALRLRLQRRADLLGRDRDLVDPHADGVVDGVGDRGRNRQQRPLPDLLRAERAVRDRDPRRETSRPRASPASSGSCTRASRGTCGRRCRSRPSDRPSPPSSPRRGPCRRSPRPGR